MSSLLLLLVILIFCNYSPSSDAIRSFPINEPEKKNLYETHVMLSESNHGFRFSEAPEFRNGANCRGFVSSSSSSSSSSWGCDLSESDDHVVHISMTLDFEYLRGSMAAILSLLKHASCPDDIFFHFIAIESEQRNLIQLIRSTFPSLVNFKVYQFTEHVHVKNLISSSIREALENPLNYARNYLADLLEPCVKRVIYLDSDLVVVDDIQKLWNISHNGVISAPEYCHTNFTSYFTHGFWSDSEMSSRVFSGRNHQPCYFNTGVMVMDLERWREGDYRRRIEGWMELQKQKRIYQLGSLPPFLLVFAGDIQGIDHRWNQHGLGGDNVMGSCRSLHPGPVSLLHWSGKGKPWLRLDQRNPCPLDHLWEPYDLYLPHPLRSPF